MAIRIAKVAFSGFGHDADSVSAYLPDNYRVGYCNATDAWIIGEDKAGWTLEYVLERLASGGIYGKEDR